MNRIARKISIDWPILNDDGDEIGFLEIKLSCTPGDPGRIFGPPEDCYPPEPPEIEILQITDDRTKRRYTDKEIDEFQKKNEEAVFERAIDALMD